MVRVAVGGTFDPLHEGHLALLKKAFQVAGRYGTVVVALTSDEMAKSQRTRKVRDFQTRERNLREILLSRLGASRFEVEKLHDVFGSAIEEDYDIIVVSPETLPMAYQINEIRRENKLDPIRIVSIECQMAEDNERISSTRICMGEIDGKGKLLIQSG